MPKIIVNEYDKTKAGQLYYANFSVVVPGFVSDAYNEDCFDDNGVFECSSQKEFLENIGRVEYYDGYKPAEAAIPCLPSAAVEVDEEFDATKKYYLAEETHEAAGELVDANGFRYTLLDPQPTGTCTEADKYYPIADANVGKDAVPEVPGTLHQIGNQIAYELLGLGYTVLYKKLTKKNEVDNEELADDIEPWQEEIKSSDFWDALRDKSIYDFRYLITGIINDKKELTCKALADQQIEQLATFTNTSDFSKQISTLGRGDCIALVDISEACYDTSNVNLKTQSQIITSIKAKADAEAYANKFSALCAPYVEYDIVDDVYENTHFPASFDYLACSATALSNGFAEWYAMAGYNRGIRPYRIKGVGYKFGEIAIDMLQGRNAKNNRSTRAVNLVVNFKDQYYFWGNRTAVQMTDESELTASNFLNIRQLCCTLKKQIYVVCRRLTFDPNSSILWTNFCDGLIPILERMKADQGIRDYKIVQVADSKKAFLKANVRIVPIEAVEDFEIGVTLEDEISGNVEIEE